MADNKKSNSKLPKDVLGDDKLFQDLFKDISGNTYAQYQSNRNQIDELEKDINTVISSDIDDMKQYTGDDLTTYILKTLNRNDREKDISNLNKAVNTDSLDALFTGKDGSIFSVFSERFKNKALLFHDLEIIVDQLVEINEAINTTRDDICASDDIGAEMARSLNFSCTSTDKDRYDDLIDLVKEMEKQYKLNEKIREHIIPKTLKYGEYYVYVIPESKMFERAQQDRMDNTSNISMESTDIELLSECFNVTSSEGKKNLNYKKEGKELSELLCENVHVNNDDLALPLLEQTGSMNAVMDLRKYNKIDAMLMQNKSSKKPKEDPMKTMGFSDGVKSKKAEDWDNHKGCYIKLLDPKRVIPVKIMDYIIGYYYVQDSNFDILNHNCRSNAVRMGSLLDQVEAGTANERNIINSLASSIVKSFDKDYLNDNIKFKELIINSLLYNDTYKKKMHYQFIPADNICRFSINEDEDGNGQSILFKSLFYAKLYLSILVFNMITFITKSQDTKVHYVKTSGMDKNVVNKTMRLAQQMKAGQITIGDLMDYSAIYGKVGTGRDIFLPTGESGERGMEMDILAGQDVNMQSDFMEMLKKSYINGTGVPSVIMNYIDEAEFAKTLVMANAKQMRRVMTFQESFNEDLTRLYQMIMLYSSDIENEDISNFAFKFMRPKTLPNSNLVDTMGYGDQLLEFFDKAYYGQYQQTDDPDMLYERDMFRKELSRDLLDFMPWDMVDKVTERLKLHMAEYKTNHPKTPTEGNPEDQGF